MGPGQATPCLCVYKAYKDVQKTNWELIDIKKISNYIVIILIHIISIPVYYAAFKDPSLAETSMKPVPLFLMPEGRRIHR